MGKRTGKAKSPTQILAENAERRRRDFAAAGLDPGVADLVTFSDVEVVRKDKSRDRTFGRRSNVFRLLLERKTITPNQHDAAYRLAQDWAAWKGLDGKGERSEAVDGGSGSAELVTDRMIQAGKRIWGDGSRVVGALQVVSPSHVPLITAFMVATVEEDRAMAWRGVVERVTGETVRDKQTARVVDALEALREVYEQPRRAAA